MSREPTRSILRKPFTRRDAMKAAPIAAVTAAGAGLALWGRTSGATETRKGTCRFCLMHCGIVGSVRDGRLIKVEGDRSSKTRGFICEHGFALREVVHSHARLTQPLIRRGSEFHEVTWAEAISFVAEKLKAVKARHGPEAFLVQTGWPLVRHPLVNVLHRFMRAFGSPNVSTVASLCEASLRMGQALTVGTKYSADVRASKTLVLWGANPSVSAPPFAHIIAQKTQRGNLIVVDPFRTALARQATVHLQVRPGTDGALALGLIHLVLREPLSPEIVRDVAGLESLTALAATYEPERVEQLTSIPKTQLERVARMLSADGPIGIWQGLGVEHHENGVQTSRAITALEVLCGRFHSGLERRSELTAPSENFEHEPLPALYRLRTPEPVPPPIVAKPLGHASFPLYELFNREAQGQLLADAVLDSKPYPVRAVMLVASNALVTSQGTQRLGKAVDALELLVAVDPFLTPSAQRADVVLPSTTFAEAASIDDDDSASGRLVAPPGEARDDYAIIRSLAEALGLGAYFPWPTFQEFSRAPHVPWLLDDELQPKPQSQETKPRFGTPSGKAELHSSLLERTGHAPLPEWTAPTEPLTPEFPLRLVTGPRPRAYINSQFRGVPSIESRMREPEVLVHPTAAARFKLVNGAKADVVSPYGRAAFVVVITEDVHEEVAIISAGWASSNANTLISPDRRDPISGFPAFRSGACRIERHD